MRNQDRYKTAQERAEAFRSFCQPNVCHDCQKCKVYGNGKGTLVDCVYQWLDLEAEEEKPLPCYMCGSNRITSYKAEVGYSLICRDCGYCAGTADTREEIEAKHNRVAKKCREVTE